MASLDLTDTLKTLQGERAQTQKKLTKLDRAIDVIRELAGTETAPNGRPKKHIMSVAARRKMRAKQKAKA
jgi:hypothetical protein